MTSPSRSQRVDGVRIVAGLCVWQLWLDYQSLSGVADLIEVDGYLHGVFTLTSDEEDKLCLAVNEELDELHRAAWLPYSSPSESAPVSENPLDVLRDLLDSARGDYANTTDDAGLRLASRCPRGSEQQL